MSGSSRTRYPTLHGGLGSGLNHKEPILTDSQQLRRKSKKAALTLVFRFMFLLHTEARGYLPIGSSAYRPHSARQLAEDSRMAQSSFSRRGHSAMGQA